MSWPKSQLFWKMTGLYVLLSLLGLGGLLAALNSQLQQQSEDLHRQQAEQLAEQISSEFAAAQISDQVLAHWHDILTTLRYQLWLVDERARPLGDSDREVPQRAVIQSAVRTAARNGSSVRWMGDSADRRQVLIVARRCVIDGDRPAVILLLSDSSTHAESHRLAAAAAGRGAFFTWIIGVLCVTFIAMGLVGPLRIMTRNLDATVERTQRQDMLLRISDRHDELGDVAASLTELEKEREDRICELETADRTSRAAVVLLTAVLDSMVEGVIAVDAGENILFLNAAARRLLSIGDVIGVGNRLYEAVRMPTVLDTVNDVIQKQSQESLEFRTPRDGLRLALVANPIRQGPRAGAVVVVRDVSDRHRLDTMRRDFVSGVSHELKTPLTVIQACTETLLQGALDDREAAVRFLTQIEEQSERLLRLILGMLQLARVESGTEAFRQEQLNLTDIAEHVVESLRPLAASRHVQLVQDSPSEVEILADPQALRTIISNLVENAIKYSDPDGTVTIQISTRASGPVLIVRDQGMGISREHLSRIFERFYRVDRDRSRERGGTGLGLAIVKHLCQTMKATVTVDSEVGRGTEFCVAFGRQATVR